MSAHSSFPVEASICASLGARAARAFGGLDILTPQFNVEFFRGAPSSSHRQKGMTMHEMHQLKGQFLDGIRECALQ